MKAKEETKARRKTLAPEEERREIKEAKGGGSKDQSLEEQRD